MFQRAARAVEINLAILLTPFQPIGIELENTQAATGKTGTIKGTVSQDFTSSVFYHKTTPYGPLIKHIKYF